MKKILIFIICLLIFSSCATTKDYNIRRGLMLLEPNEIPRNKELKYSKKKSMKILHKRIEKEQKKLKRKYKK